MIEASGLVWVREDAVGDLVREVCIDKDVVWALGSVVLTRTLHRGIGVVKACEAEV